MQKLEVLTYPDKRLRKTAEPVVEVDAEIREIIDNMFYTMYHDSGAGLAATQVNIHKRIFVMDLSNDKTKPFCMINPEIIEKRGEISLQEGCLSVPGLYANVKRSEFVRVKALDRAGEEFEMEFDDYEARCILHEIDHLNGVLFVDHLSPLKRKMAEKKLQKRIKTRM